MTLRLSQAEKDRWSEIVEYKNEPDYQREAYLKLVTLPFNEVTRRFHGEFFLKGLVDKLNHAIKEQVEGWVESKRHFGSDFTVDRFLWTVRYDDTQNSLEFDHFPELLQELKEGKAKIKLFRPSYDLLMRMVEAEINKSKTQVDHEDW